MYNVIDKLLVCVRVAYWYKYCDDLKDMKGDHFSGFGVISVFSTLFSAGIFLLISILIFYIFQYNSTHLLEDKPAIFLFCLPFGICLTYLLCYKNKHYLAGKEYLNQFPIEEQEIIGKKSITKCWTIACSPYFILLFILASKM